MRYSYVFILLLLLSTTALALSIYIKPAYFSYSLETLAAKEQFVLYEDGQYRTKVYIRHGYDFELDKLSEGRLSNEEIRFFQELVEKLDAEYPTSENCRSNTVPLRLVEFKGRSQFKSLCAVGAFGLPQHVSNIINGEIASANKIDRFFAESPNAEIVLTYLLFVIFAIIISGVLLRLLKKGKLSGENLNEISLVASLIFFIPAAPLLGLILSIKGICVSEKGKRKLPIAAIALSIIFLLIQIIVLSMIVIIRRSFLN
ncbi:hypothetical protein J4211_03070 [Candidatus Woesearchaeota archaeon]|nr:hypothetical protein [Candidatus Woesearchaeota archaeon]